MKRFYCTICKRVKRVRRYPASVTNTSAFDVMERTGTCSYHHNQSSLYSVNYDKLKVGK